MLFRQALRDQCAASAPFTLTDYPRSRLPSVALACQRGTSGGLRFATLTTRGLNVKGDGGFIERCTVQSLPRSRAFGSRV
jgi:hypothetical protein